MPEPAEGEILICIISASIGTGDYFGMRETPFQARLTLGYPKPRKDYIAGLDFAGIVESIGKDLGILSEYIEAGWIVPVIDRSYALSDAPDAFRYLDEGHAREKVIITMGYEPVWLCRPSWMSPS